MAGPNTHREALIAELLGDVDGLLKRAEALHETLPAVTEAAEAKIKAAGEASAAAINEAGVKLSRGLERQGGDLLREIQEGTRQTQAAAKGLRASGAKLWGLVIVAVLAGAIAGAVAALLVIHGGLGA
jgi:hypothetical protein